MQHGPSRANRVNFSTLRNTIYRTASGYDDVDNEQAIGMLAEVLRSTCPHDATQHIMLAVIDKDGRSLSEVTRPACNVA